MILIEVMLGYLVPLLGCQRFDNKLIPRAPGKRMLFIGLAVHIVSRGKDEMNIGWDERGQPVEAVSTRIFELIDGIEDDDDLLVCDLREPLREIALEFV